MFHYACSTIKAVNQLPTWPGKVYQYKNNNKKALTTCTSDGIRDKKSANSLLSTAFGLRIFLVNLLIPQASSKNLRGTRYRTIVPIVNAAQAR